MNPVNFFWGTLRNNPKPQTAKQTSANTVARRDFSGDDGNSMSGGGYARKESGVESTREGSGYTGVHIGPVHPGGNDMGEGNGNAEEYKKEVVRLKAVVKELQNRSLESESESRKSQKLIQTLEEDVRKWRQYANGLVEQKAESQRRAREMEEKNKVLEKRCQDVEERYRSWNERTRLLEERNRQLEDSHRLWEEQSKRQTRATENSQDDLHKLKSQFDKTVALLESRTTELSGAKMFLTNQDSLSGAEVSKMVETLNAEILQIAAFMADSFSFGQRMADDALESACQKGEPYIGGAMIRLIRSIKHEEDPTLIQVAIQGCLIATAKRLITAWQFDKPDVDNFLNEICKSAQQSESQVIYGRWRVLTHTYVNQKRGNESRIVDRLVTYIAGALSNTLLIAGCEEHPTSTLVKEKFGDRISTIVNLGLRLNTTIGVDITSSDLEVITVTPECLFDSSAMVDAYGDDMPAKQAPGRVLCTIDLGLRRTEKVAKNGKFEVESDILLKPKVVLESLAESFRG